jgi:hypothetical protein
MDTPFGSAWLPVANSTSRKNMARRGKFIFGWMTVACHQRNFELGKSLFAPDYFDFTLLTLSGQGGFSEADVQLFSTNLPLGLNK